MKKLSHGLTLLFFILCTITLSAQPPSGYNILKNYNFGSSKTVKNSTDLKQHFNWGLERGNPLNINFPYANDTEWQRYTTPLTSNNYVLASDHLKLIARYNKDDGDGILEQAEISSGCIRTKDTYRPTATKSYYFEARMKIPAGKALWPAFWIYTQRDWPHRSEIDIVEVVNDVNGWNSTKAPEWKPIGYYNNIHPSTKGDDQGKQFKINNLSSGYHTWACEWTSTQVKFYFDGNLTRTESFPVNNASIGWGGANPGHVIINLAAGGGWPGPADDKNAFPASLDVDYLRIYEKGDTPPPSGDIPTFTLENNKWRIFTLPADPGNNNRVLDIISDDIPGVSGTDWVIYTYNANKGEYVSYGKYATLKPGIGYWIIQKSGTSKVIDMPAGSTAITASNYDVYLFNKSGATTWNMVGNPYSTAISTGNIRIKTGNGVCASGCDLNTANSNDIVANQLFSFDGTKYITHTPSSAATLNPWIGFWAASLKNAASAGGSFMQFHKSSGAKNANTKVQVSSSLKNISPPQALANDLELNSFYAISDITPNPSKGFFNFNFSSAYKGEVSIKVFSIDGRQIENIKLQKTNEKFTHQINLSNKASGIYIISFEAGDYHSNLKIIKN